MRRKQRCIVCQVHAPADNHFTFSRSDGKLCEADFIAQHLWLPTECCRAQRIFGGKPRTVTGSFHLSTDDSIPERSGGCYPPLQLRRQSRRRVPCAKCFAPWLFTDWEQSWGFFQSRELRYTDKSCKAVSRSLGLQALRRFHSSSCWAVKGVLASVSTSSGVM
mgnify:CR=1 FL=1